MVLAKHWCTITKNACKKYCSPHLQQTLLITSRWKVLNTAHRQHHKLISTFMNDLVVP